MSSPMTIQISRGKLIALMACLATAAVLLFVAGTATGLLVASQGNAPGTLTPKRPEVRASLPAEPKLTTSEQGSEPDASQSKPANDESAAEIPGSGSVDPAADADGSAPLEATLPQPATVPAGNPIPRITPASSSAAPAADTKSSAAPQSGPAASSASDDSEKIPLTIRVCSFSSKASADKMIASLTEHGYQPTLTHSLGADGRAWYVIKLGPYMEWDKASEIAAQVAIAENVQPVVAPAR